MPLDPRARAFLDQLLAAGAPPFEATTPAEARAQMAALFAPAAIPEPVARVEERRVGDLPVRVYTPAGRPPFPVLVFFHGGGWVLGSLDTTDTQCRAFANAVPAVVVSVDYRLAPEHKFPAAAEDAHAATRWAAAHAAELGGDPARVAVGGDSAGGNLAAVTALMARDRGGPRLAYQILIYPATDAGMDTPSCRENADGYLLTRALLGWFWGHYLRAPADGADPLASPLRSRDLRGLPPAFVLTAEFDPLRDEGEAYAERLRSAGVAVTSRRSAGMIHGFFGLPAVFPQAGEAVHEAAAALRAAVGHA